MSLNHPNDAALFAHPYEPARTTSHFHGSSLTVDPDEHHLTEAMDAVRRDREMEREIERRRQQWDSENEPERFGPF